MHFVTMATLALAVMSGTSLHAQGETPAHWVRCVSAAGRFSVRLPGRFVRQTVPIEGPGRQPAVMLSLSAENRDAAYLAAFTDYGRPAQSMSREALQSKVCRGVLAVVRARLVQQRQLCYRGREGVEIRALRDPLVDENGSPYVHLRCFVVGGRVYALLQAGRLRRPNPRFFDSFRMFRRRR